MKFGRLPRRTRRAALLSSVSALFVAAPLLCLRPLLADPPVTVTPAIGSAFPPPVSTSVPPSAGSGVPISSPASDSDTDPAAPWPAAGARDLLARKSLHLMGDNNGVSFWVHGDGSKTTLRVRLFATGSTAAPATVAALRPVWISRPISLSFTGWRPITIPKKRFTLVIPPAVEDQVNPLLPDDAQFPGAVPLDAPDWTSIDTIALETKVASRATLIVDDISWVTIDGTTGSATSSTSVDDFEQGNLAAWQPLTTAASAQPPSLSYRLATAPGQAHRGRIALKLEIVSPAVYRQTTLMTQVNQTLAAQHKTFLIFTPGSLFDPILPSSLPPRQGSSVQISMTACPEQIQAASFCIYTQKTLKDVSIALAGDLQEIKHTIARRQVDVDVVKVWQQDGVGLLRDAEAAGPVGELLVKDDRIPLSGTAPSIRLTGAPATDIPADSTKQFWVTVSVPRGTFPGHYSGRLMVSSRGMPAFPVVMDLNVLPLRLLSPAKQYGIDLRSRLDAPPANLPSSDGRSLVTDFVSKQEMASQLSDIYAHGFRIATLYDDPETLWDAVDLYKAAGLNSPYNIYKGEGDPKEIETERQSRHEDTLLYYAAPAPVPDAQARMAALKGDGLQATTYITRPAEYDAFQANMDLPVYNRDSSYVQQLLRSSGVRVSSKRDWWYWSATDENPRANRVSCGFLLWRANLYGAFVPDYQTAYGSDPYDQSNAGASPLKLAFRPQMLTYPVQGGVLDTVKWEAAREGITDVRYLTTMFAAMRECKDAHIDPDLTAEAETYVKTLLDRPLALMTDTDFDAARAKIADYAVRMRTDVDAYNKAHHIQ